MDDSVVFTLKLIYACILLPLLWVSAAALLIVASKQLSKLSENKTLISICNLFGIGFLLYSVMGALFSLEAVFTIVIRPLLGQ